MLSYAKIDGRPVLTGAVYALLLRPGEVPPPVMGGAGMWHDHSGTLDDESSLPVHHGALSDASAPRLMVLHAWVGVPNPAGLLEADNWALPYVRAGVPTPSSISVSAARALSLLNGGIEYYTAMALAEGANPVVVRTALEASSRAVDPIARRMRTSRTSTSADIAALENVWKSAMRDLTVASGPAISARLNGGVSEMR